VRDMVAVLDHLGLERAVVTGHSLGAYVAARLAVRHPERVERLVLVDGGLTIPESREVADPAGFIDAFLGPTLDRLKMTFASVDAYAAWWAAHPAMAGADVDPTHLRAYAAHDLVGDPPQMRSSINPQVVRDDGLDLFSDADADDLTVPTVLLAAPKGMVDDPHPMQPLAVVQRWADADSERRLAIGVPGVNHYTIVFGEHGARTVAEAIARAAAA
ncbi:MAG TPA: alpha/beta hydrolase, partial [Solirubrobacteraceae bacterium]|nr:alpha/beta hydrolase [Solirubrobacteraceae bacterium]